MRSHWRRNGPPLNIAALAIAASLGIDLIGKDDPEAVADLTAPAGPSIAELAAIMAVPAGHDTREASRLIVERLGHVG